MSRGRAFRRAQWDRAKKRAIRFLKTFVPSHADVPSMIAARATDRTPCSCPMCGNPRKHFGEKTAQEIAAELPRREVVALLEAVAADVGGTIATAEGDGR